MCPLPSVADIQYPLRLTDSVCTVLIFIPSCLPFPLLFEPASGRSRMQWGVNPPQEKKRYSQSWFQDDRACVGGGFGSTNMRISILPSAGRWPPSRAPSGTCRRGTPPTSAPWRGRPSPLLPKISAPPPVVDVVSMGGGLKVRGSDESARLCARDDSGGGPISPIRLVWGSQGGSISERGVRVYACSLPPPPPPPVCYDNHRRGFARDEGPQPGPGASGVSAPVGGERGFRGGIPRGIAGIDPERIPDQWSFEATFSPLCIRKPFFSTPWGNSLLTILGCLLLVFGENPGRNAARFFLTKLTKNRCFRSRVRCVFFFGMNIF